MGRRYIITFKNVSVSAAQDLIQINGAAGKIVRVLEAKWGLGTNSGGLPASQTFATQISFLPATVTNGSGGFTPTIGKIDAGDATASLTALANNTTPATTSGTAVVLDESGDHVYNGYRSPQSWLMNNGANAPVCGPSEAIVFSLLTTPSAAMYMSGSMLVEEIGG